MSLGMAARHTFVPPQAETHRRAPEVVPVDEVRRSVPKKHGANRSLKFDQDNLQMTKERIAFKGKDLVISPSLGVGE